MIKKAFIAAIAIILLLSSAYASNEDPEADNGKIDDVEIYYTIGAKGLFGQASDESDPDAIRLAAIKAKKPETTLLVGSGDIFTYNSANLATKGAYAIDLMKFAGYSFASFGSRAFLYGPLEAQALSQRASLGEKGFVYASSNLQKNSESFLEEVRVENIKGRLVGFFGLASETTPLGAKSLSDTDSQVTNPIQEAKKPIDELLAMGCEAVVCCSDLTWEEGKALDNAYAGKITAIIGRGGESGKLMNGALYCSAGSSGEGIGRLTLSFGQTTGKLAGAKSEVLGRGDLEGASPSKTLLSDASALITSASEASGEAMGESEAIMENGTAENPKETDLGDLVADSLKDAAKTDIAAVRASLIKTSMPKGLISRETASRILPGLGYTVVVSVTARQVKEMLEDAVANNMRFVYVSGMTFSYEPKASSGNRVTYLKINGKAVNFDSKTTYTLAIEESMASGEVAYSGLSNVGISRDAMPLQQAFAEYLRKIAHSQTKVALKDNGRITVEYQSKPKGHTALDYVMLASGLFFPALGLCVIAWAKRPKRLHRRRVV